MQSFEDNENMNHEQAALADSIREMLPGIKVGISPETPSGQFWVLSYQSSRYCECIKAELGIDDTLEKAVHQTALKLQAIAMRQLLQLTEQLQTGDPTYLVGKCDLCNSLMPETEVYEKTIGYGFYKTVCLCKKHYDATNAVSTVVEKEYFIDPARSKEI
jgi:hypothetical protein